MTQDSIKNRKVVVAGATGYLGSCIVSELKQGGYAFAALARNKSKLQKAGLTGEEIIIAEATDPTTLKGKLEGIDTLISCVGITRQKDGLTYMDVDYQSNLNLLLEAKRAGIRKFIYVSVLNGQFHRNLKINQAKEKFVDALKASGMDYAIIRPNGFFSDMSDFLDMARGGKVYLFGDGDKKLNPIHGEDLAKFILEQVDRKRAELEVGGPDVLTQNEIAEMALSAFGKKKRIIHLPSWIIDLVIGGLRTFTSSKFYGPYEFFLTMMKDDNVAPRYGVRRLETYFKEEADRIS
jgi:uncharacterized protein YbjT (DUF2867 family)